MDERLNKSNRLPGSEKLTRPEEIGQLSKYLKSIKKVYEESTRLEDQLIGVSGYSTGKIPEINSLEKKSVKTPINQGEDVDLSRKILGVPGKKDGNNKLEGKRLELRDPNIVSKLDNRMITSPGNQGGDISQLGEVIKKIQDVRNQSLSDKKVELLDERWIALEDTRLNLQALVNTSLENKRIDLKDEREVGLGNKRVELEGQQNPELETTRLNLEDGRDTKLGDKKIGLEDKREVSLSDTILKLNEQEESKLSEKRLDIQDERIESLETKRIELSAEENIELGDKRIKLEDNNEVKLGDKRVELEDQQNPELETTRLDIIDSRENRLGDKKIKLEDERTLNLSDKILGIKDDKTPELEDTRINISDDRDVKLGDKKVEISDERTLNLSDKILNLTDDKTPELEDTRINISDDRDVKLGDKKIEISDERTLNLADKILGLKDENTLELEDTRLDLTDDKTLNLSDKILGLKDDRESELGDKIIKPQDNVNGEPTELYDVMISAPDNLNGEPTELYDVMIGASDNLNPNPEELSGKVIEGIENQGETVEELSEKVIEGIGNQGEEIESLSDKILKISTEDQIGELSEKIIEGVENRGEDVEELSDKTISLEENKGKEVEDLSNKILKITEKPVDDLSEKVIEGINSKNESPEDLPENFIKGVENKNKEVEYLSKNTPSSIENQNEEVKNLSDKLLDITDNQNNDAPNLSDINSIKEYTSKLSDNDLYEFAMKLASEGEHGSGKTDGWLKKIEGLMSAYLSSEALTPKRAIEFRDAINNTLEMSYFGNSLEFEFRQNNREGNGGTDSRYSIKAGEKSKPTPMPESTIDDNYEADYFEDDSEFEFRQNNREGNGGTDSRYSVRTKKRGKPTPLPESTIDDNYKANYFGNSLEFEFRQNNREGNGGTDSRYSVKAGEKGKPIPFPDSTSETIIDGDVNNLKPKFIRTPIDTSSGTIWAKAEDMIGEQITGTNRRDALDEMIVKLVDYNRNNLPSLPGSSIGTMAGDAVKNVVGIVTGNNEHLNPINKPLSADGMSLPGGPGDAIYQAANNRTNFNTVDVIGDTIGNTFYSRYWNSNSFKSTLEELCPIVGKAPIASLMELKAILKSSPYFTSPGKFMTDSKGSYNTFSLDTNMYWEVTIEPYCSDKGTCSNGGVSFLPSIKEINLLNKRIHGVSTNYGYWAPINSFELQKSKLSTKSLPLYEGEISYPVGMEFSNELRLTFVDDAWKSWKRYFERCAEVAVYNSEAHEQEYYTKEPDNLTKIDKTYFCISPYKNITFSIKIYILNPQLNLLNKFNLLCVLKDYSEEYVGEIDSGGTDLNVSFSIVGENPQEDITKLIEVSKEVNRSLAIQAGLEAQKRITGALNSSVGLL